VYAATDPQLVSDLVYGGAPADPDLTGAARRQGVRLVSFVEYQGLMDLRGYVAAQTARLDRDPLYPPSLYLPQRFRRLDTPAPPHTAPTQTAPTPGPARTPSSRSSTG
jgi:hypothetical protein